MQVEPLPFTGSGQIEAGNPVEVAGVAYTGFTQVVLHNGTDATGPIVAVCGGQGTYGWNYEILCDQGLYIEASGSGSGTVWIPG